MGIHGFAAGSEFEVVEHSNQRVTLLLRNNASTETQYPFNFSFLVCYEIQNTLLQITYVVHNLDSKQMYFGIGGHPGFRVPFNPLLKFSDYYLEFSSICTPTRVGMSDDCFVSGIDETFPLIDSKRINLQHRMFDNDAIVLKNTAKSVVLKSDLDSASICVTFPQLSYLGLWHAANTDAPYLCIEPWSSLPSRKGIVEDLSCQSDLVTLIFEPRINYLRLAFA